MSAENTIARIEVARILLDKGYDRFPVNDYEAIRPLIPAWNLGKVVSMDTLDYPLLKTTVTASRQLAGRTATAQDIAMQEHVKTHRIMIAEDVNAIFKPAYDKSAVDIDRDCVIQIRLEAHKTHEEPMVTPGLVGRLILADLEVLSRVDGIVSPVGVDLSLVGKLLRQY